MQRQRGFTLFELIIVVVIIAAAAALTMPNLTAGARQREVRRTMQQFVSAVRRASSVAVFTRSAVELQIDPEEHRYRVVIPKTEEELAEEAKAEENQLRRLGTGSASKTEEPDFGGDVRLDVALPDAAEFGEIEGGGVSAEQQVLILFYPNGSSSGATIEFLFDEGERREQSYTIQINPLTSAISFTDEEDS